MAAYSDRFATALSATGMVHVLQGATRRASVCLLAVALVLCGIAPAHAVVWRVNVTSTAATPDGQSWASAYPKIQSAVDAAVSGDEVWVAAGIYYYGPNEEVVKLKDGITLYGGFSGTETAREQRDWMTRRTIIDGHDYRRGVTSADTGVVNGCTLRNGHKTINGGGMFGGTAINCTFTGNYSDAMHGGTAVNCLFIENSSGMNFGAAINCTFVGNHSGMNGGTATNCIIFGNGWRETHATTVSYSCLSVETAGTGNITADPDFVNQYTGDFRLRANSPCVDSGTLDSAPAMDMLERMRPQGAGVDMGAYEYFSGDDANAVIPPAVLRVNAASTAAAPDGLTWDTAFPTLQAAANLAGYGTELWVAHGTYTAPEGNEALRLPWPGVSVYGGFAGSETVRDERCLDAALTVVDGQQRQVCIRANPTVRVETLTVQNAVDGGMHWGNAVDCVFRDNKGFVGGGMRSGIAIRCTFAGNSAVDCGGGAADCTVTDCAFTGNTATMDGGGMSFCTATNCSIVDNTAKNHGGGMDSGTATNCTFTRNSAVLDGGGMANGTAINCIFAENVAEYIGGAASASSVANCVFFGNRAAENGAMVAGLAVNCIVWGNTPNETVGGGFSFSCLSAAVPGAGNIVGDPLFVNAVAGDFRLQSGSRCIDAGTNEGAPVADILGVTRPQGVTHDMGVYEMVQVTVPDLVGQSQTAALKAITGAGLVIGKMTEEYSATVPVGMVVSQTPAAGEMVLPSTAVALVVSRGVQPTTMPDVLGQPRAQAEAAVTAAGLVLGLVTQVYSGTVAAGSVISQSPAAGSEVPPGTTVTIVLSLGPVPVPEGEGESVDADTARQRLTDAYDTADINGDGMLSFEEASGAMTGLTHATFGALDTNGDGRLSPDELSTDTGTGCAGCRGRKGGWLPFGSGKGLGDLFLTGLGLMGMAVVAGTRRP